MTTHPVFAFSDQFVDDLAALIPTLATQIGLPGHDHRWDDLSPAGHDQIRGILVSSRDELEGLGPGGDQWDRLAVAVAGETIDNELEYYEHGDHLREIAHVASVFDRLRDIFDQMDTSTPEGWDDVCTRLETIDAPLTGWRATLREGVKAGVVGQRRQVESVIEQMRASIGPGASYRGLLDRFDEEQTGTAAVRYRLQAAVEKACAAVAAAADALESDYLPHADPADGVGSDRYLRAAHRQLGMQIDPRETYAWGWRHLAELRKRITEVAGRIDPDRDLDGVARLLKTDPGRAAHGQDAFREVIQARLDQALASLEGTHFDIPDEIRTLEVRTAPPGAPPGAWYKPPSEDFSRPGSAWWSFGDAEHIPLYEEISTAYHEGFPGHHMQVGVQLTLADRLSRLHRLFYWNPGYGEGWALYTERLMDELGYLDVPDYEFGMLTGSLLRAARVVIDLGLHLDLPIPDGQPFHPGERWTHQLGVEMLTDYAFLNETYAESEVTRYLGWPAQAISYKVGERVILELREEMRRRLGDDYDAKTFHAAVLGHGPVGLDLLRTLVLGGLDSPGPD